MMKDKEGRWLTKALFKDLASPDTIKRYPPKWTLDEFRNLYLSENDPTEYKFAIKILGSWDHWQKMTESPSLSLYINKWREELEIKIKSDAIRDIVEFSKADKGFQAAKWLADGEWNKRKAGRPTKAEVERNERIRTGIRDEIDEDEKRVSLLN